MQHLRLATAVIAVAALAACKGQSNANSTDTASMATAKVDSGTPGVPAAAPAAPTDTTANANAPTDATLLGKALAGDSAEVAIAKYMASNTKNASVKAYADLLEKDHGKGMNQVVVVAKKVSLTPTLPANDTTAQETSHVLDNLKGLNGNDRDTAFVNHEIVDHQHDIDDTKAAISSAQNADVKAMLQKEMPELQKHLDRAQALSKQLQSKK